MKKIILTMMAVAASFALVSCASTSSTSSSAPATGEVGKPLQIDNFEGQNMGGIWSIYNDKGNGGNSTAKPDPWEDVKEAGKGANGTNTYGKCSGRVTTRFQYGFAGVGYQFDPKDENKILDISAYKGIHFWMKGDGKTYSLAIKSPKVNPDFCYHYWSVVAKPEWTEYTLDFSNAKQDSWGASNSMSSSLRNAIGFQFQTNGQPIPAFEFEIDEFNFY